MTALHHDEPGAAMLVRPDGHLAWTGTDAAALGDWIDRRVVRNGESS